MPDNHRSMEKQETRPQGQRRRKAPPEVDKIHGEAQAAGGEFSQKLYGMAAKKAMSNEFKNVNQMHSGKLAKSKAKISSKGPQGKR